ncbi:MAG: peptidase, partial [Bryobacterales bacterium]|nr:peptidase [Bryobacterales bacterium]
MRSLIAALGFCSVIYAAASSGITPSHLLGYIRVLSSDEFAGRGPGTPGEQKTVGYLIAQATKLGLQPGNPDGTFIQKVPLWGIRTSGTVALTAAGKELPMTPRQDYLLSSQNPKTAIDIVNSPIVFAGYGVVAPRYGWDDYKNIDVKGKTVLILSGDPPVPDPNNPAQLDEKMFLGKALSAYGRPASKYETAYAKGAVAVLTIFTPRTGA